ncbi:MAG: hypothetical protein IK010_02050 [Bacteroidales bacterium]|nr:hypothetical protein [Bacteroidales bacterium]MBR5093337.1 hypothetical protein [Bacteroidales bacterium]
MKKLLIILLLLPLGMKAQEPIDSIQSIDTMVSMAPPEPDTVYILRTDTVVRYHTDSVYILRVDTVVQRVADTAALSAMKEKERFYREILSNNGVDKEKLEAERNYYIHMVDSLRSIVRIAEIEAVRKEEANKYLEERAKAAEEKVAVATNRKKKIRPIQGVAMRFYRTPAWEIRLKGGSQPNTYDKYISNRNEGSVEFDFTTGASVMLWDLTKYFNQDHTFGGTGREIRRFDQDFAYDLGFYVGFGGSNLFKNFYTGLSFRFVDFFYLTLGVNIAEYQVLKKGYTDGDVIGASLSIDDVTAKAWLVNPFLSLSIDLDFLSYIKK